jgi:hypothetical protein
MRQIRHRERIVPDATCLRISGRAALSRGTMSGRVRPITSRATTTTWRLAGLRFCGAPIDALGLPIRLFDVAARVHAIDFDGAG